MKTRPTTLLWFFPLAVAFLFAASQTAQAKSPKAPRLTIAITEPGNGAAVASPVEFFCTVANGTPPYTYLWTFRRGTPKSISITSTLQQLNVASTFAAGRQKATLKVIDSNRKRAKAAVNFTVQAAPASPPKSINTTSQNGNVPRIAPLAEQPPVGLTAFQILAANDLGMHCGDLDHRVASILPPFNVVHAQVLQKGTLPGILTGTDVSVVYSAASNANDPALQNPPPSAGTPVFKTNFWDVNPRTGNHLAFDAYDPFYPAGALSPTLPMDLGFPVVDLELFYPTGGGPGALKLDQQAMPSATSPPPAIAASPYQTNAPQSFARFDTDFPFFVTFLNEFGYRLLNVNWFAADGIPIAPFDDLGRKNSYPLMRIQAKDNGALTNQADRLLASIDAVLPVSAEAECHRCHTSSVDGGNGQAACIPQVDPACVTEGSLRSNAQFTVVQASQDPAGTGVPAAVNLEWAADNNILRLHDAKHPEATLQGSQPVVCQKCHYTPALDLAHFGPLGPGNQFANGRDQKVHRTNSRVLHTFHSQFTDLFDNTMPPPNDSQRTDAQGRLVINALVEGKLNQSCYQCHPGRVTRCLRGTMFNGGLICQDCHGTMQQVGNDFSLGFSATTPFPAGADLTKRIPWASEPGCQSCHTGDAVTNLTGTPNVIKSTDGIRLLQAYRVGDATATPITAPNSRFAEILSQDANGRRVLYRLSKGHGGVFCQACHGSTHAEWPVQPATGNTVANDNMAAIQAQGYPGKIIECAVCHGAGNVPLSQNGPHGLHPVGDNRWVNPDTGHPRFFQAASQECQACHGLTGGGTVLAKVTADRRFAVSEAAPLAKGTLVRCNLCHESPFGGGGD